MEILFKDGQVIIPLPKAVLVLSREQFVEALRAGKRYRRRQAMADRLRQASGHRRRGEDVPASGTLSGRFKSLQQTHMPSEHRGMEPRKPYPTDLSDTEWDVITHLVPQAQLGGRPEKYPMYRTDTSDAMIRVAMIHVMVRRLARITCV